MLIIRDLTKTFIGDSGRVVHALDSLSLRVKAGERVAVMGSNGSGKSTLFRILSQEMTPDGGTWEWQGQSFADNEAGTGSSAIAFVPQDPNTLAFLEMTLEEHLLWAELSGRPARIWRRGVTAARRVRYRDLLAGYGLGALVDSLQQPLNTLSGGWRQLFILIMAAARQVLAGGDARHGLILLDEPTSALDITNEQLCIDLVRRLNIQGHTILFATHDIRLALLLGERICLMQHGHLVADLAEGDARGLGPDGLEDILRRYSKLRGEKTPVTQNSTLRQAQR